MLFEAISKELTKELSEQLILEPGDVLNLSCDTNRPGAIHWFKEDIRVQQNVRIHIRGAAMEIRDVTYEDSGVYICMLRGTRKVLQNFTITVTGKISYTCLINTNW